MPRYYFHLQTRGDRLRDEQGLALPDAEAAWYQAVRSARDFLHADLELGCSFEGQIVEIEDELGAPVAELPLCEIASYAL
jgi:hypothetical protein